MVHSHTASNYVQQTAWRVYQCTLSSRWLQWSILLPRND